MRKALVQTVSCNLFSLNIQLDVILLWWNSSGRIRQMHRAARTQSIRAQAISTQSMSRGNQSIGSHTRRCSIDDQSAANQNQRPFTPLARDRLSQHNYLVTAQTITTQTITACARTIRPCERQKYAAIRSMCTRRRGESFFIHRHPWSVSKSSVTIRV
jgi:hypothetical protein